MRRALRSIARTFLPAGARKRLKRMHQRRTLSRALKRVRRDPSEAVDPGSSTLSLLVYGWGNPHWSAHEEYLAALARQVLEGSGPILECGSGLTSLMIGTLAAGSGRTLWVLEHEKVWADRLELSLDEFDIPGVEVQLAPLVPHGGFSWYDPPLDRLPTDFGMVVCDGPPADTPGGRYGLMPVMHEHLADGCVVFLDDADREGEKAVAARWVEEFGCRAEMEGERMNHFRITL